MFINWAVLDILYVNSSNFKWRDVENPQCIMLQKVNIFGAKINTDILAEERKIKKV